MAGPLPYPINRQHDGVRFARAALLTELACLTFLLLPPTPLWLACICTATPPLKPAKGACRGTSP